MLSTVELVQFEPPGVEATRWDPVTANVDVQPSPAPVVSLVSLPEALESPLEDPELKLPDLNSMILVICSNTLLQVGFCCILCSD